MQLRTGWSRLVQELVDSPGQGIRARILLECVAREPWVQACGLWRREQAPDSWSCVLVRGSPESLHGQSMVAEIAAGRSPADLVSGRGVLLSGQAAGALALTYAGLPPSEFELDLLSGLLHVARLVDAAEQVEQPSRVEGFVAALPRAPGSPPTRTLPAPDCQPAQLLAELCDSESVNSSRQRIPVELELKPGVDACHLSLSPPEFVRAVRNLVSNAREALEHMQEGGKIRILLERTLADQLVLTVEDTGPGLPSDVLEALNAHGPEDLPGPGLGLAVSWGIALSVGGRIRVAHSCESGTRLELWFPISSLA